jgi:orotidine-5'-phosphate decarboxylase
MTKQINTPAREKLIVALDVETAREALELFRALREYVSVFKIGSQLFTASGPRIVRDIVKAGGRVFLDLKFHDIPNTVAAASVEAARLGVWMLNVHAAGGREMMQRTVEAVAEVSQKEGFARPRLIAVTVLTSSDNATLTEIGVQVDAATQVTRLAQLAHECGMDGIVASPHEVAMVRARIASSNSATQDNFLIVTPGVRPTGSPSHDQRRVMTPLEAVRAGADYLVVGRAIIKAHDPARAAQEVVAEMSGASAISN